MGQIEDLKTYLTVVDSGGIARGAETLGIAKSAVSRRLMLLEDRYSTRLIDRGPGHWDLTTAGRELYERAVRLVSESDEIEADFRDISHSRGGPLTVSVARDFGLAFLQDALIDFQERHPEIRLTIDFDDRQVDLDRENYDLAIRVTEQLAPGLECLPMGEARHSLYASPDYAARTQLPTTLGELNQHPLLYFGSARRAEWVFGTGNTQSKLVFQPALNANSGQFLLQATRKGRGIARMPDFIAARAHANGELVQILPDLAIADWTISIVYSSKRRLNRRMRVFCDEMTKACSRLE